MIKITEFLGICDISELSPEGWIVVDVRDISDYEQNVEKIQKKIMLILSCWAQGMKVAVRCVCGMNRSCVVSITAFMAVDKRNEDFDTDWDDHFMFIKKRCPRMLVEIELVKTAQKALRKMYPKRWK